MNPGVTLKFPSSDLITAYLVKHPLTNTLDQKIIKAVADCFANSSKYPLGVQYTVTLRLYDLKTPLSLNELKAVTLNLTEVLEACALGKEIVFEKKSEEKSSSNSSIFPSESIISSFLKNYSFIDDSYSDDNGLTKDISYYFAGKPSNKESIEKGIPIALEANSTYQASPDFVKKTFCLKYAKFLMALADELSTSD